MSLAEFLSLLNLWPEGKTVRGQIVGCEFQNLGGFIVGFEGQLESGLGFGLCEIYEVLCPGQMHIELLVILRERLSVTIWGFGA